MTACHCVNFDRLCAPSRAGRGHGRVRQCPVTVVHPCIAQCSSPATLAATDCQITRIPTKSLRGRGSCAPLARERCHEPGVRKAAAFVAHAAGRANPHEEGFWKVAPSSASWRSAPSLPPRVTSCTITFRFSIQDSLLKQLTETCREHPQLCTHLINRLLICILT